MKIRYVLVSAALAMVLNSCGDSPIPVNPDNSTSNLKPAWYTLSADYFSLGGQVWNDIDFDGIQDCGEPTVSDIIVNLWECEGKLLKSDTTDESGYLFEDLPEGDYKLEFVAPGRYPFSPQDAFLDDEFDSDVDPITGFTDCVTTYEGVDYTNLDAGLRIGQDVISGWAWNDENMNGIQDDGEVGMAGVEVHIYSCDGDKLASTVTDAYGIYAFAAFEAGDYYLEFVNPFGFIFTYQDVGTDDALDSDVDRYQKNTICFSLSPGGVVTGWDAGLFEYEGCTFGKGFWMNHAGFGPQDDLLSKLLPIWLGDKNGDKSLVVNDAAMAVDLLYQHVYGHPSNGITRLYAHLLTVKLNVANFANPEDIYDAMVEADAFLANHDWTDWDTLNPDDRYMVLHWKNKFKQYNYGSPGGCMRP